MNYLAHIFLSGKDQDLQVGNFMGDAIKGSTFTEYPIPIQKGILLHRYIDTFTDQHAIVKLSKQRLSNQYGHYSGVLIDIFYDYFLSRNWEIYCEIPLQEYIMNFYKTLNDRYTILHPTTQKLALHLIQEDWLSKYQTLEGLEKVLIGMEKRIKYKAPLQLGIKDIQIEYNNFQNDFLKFFPILQKHANLNINKLNKQYESSL